MKDILRKSVRKRNPCRKTWGWEKRWEEVRFLEAFWRVVREVSGWNDLANSFLSRPCVERSHCPDTGTLGWREFSPIFGKGPVTFAQMDWSIQVDSGIRHEPLLEKRRRSIDETTDLAIWSLESSWEWWSRKRLGAIPCGASLTNRSHGKTGCVRGRKRKILLDYWS